MSVLSLFLSAEDVGTIFGVSPRTGRRMLSSGQLGPTFKIGRRIFIRREILLATISGLERDPRRLPGLRPTPVLPRNGTAK